MKKALACAATALFVTMSLLADPVFAAEASQASLLAQAKISEAQARTIALAKVSNGVLKSAELEHEHGRLVWSFDVAQPPGDGVTEIQIDAKTGKIALIKKESASDEAKELKADRREVKPK